jgi:peptidoglycan/LPS O-acetylase OafA/YrhL
MQRLDLEDVLGSRLLSYTVIGLAATVALAAASWYLIERPFLSLKSRPREPSAAVTEQPVNEALVADPAP